MPTAGQWYYPDTTAALEMPAMGDETTIERERPGFYEALGRTIHVLRTDQGIDRRELADRIGISYSYLAGIENGKKQPSSWVMLALAEALGLRSHELLAAAEERLERSAAMPAAPPAARTARSPWFHETGLTRARSERIRRQGTRGMSGSDVEDEEEFVDELRALAPALTAYDRRMVLELASRLGSRD